MEALDYSQAKRMRTGSISGRLRTASDLGEMGMIDKYQKGIIKDMIISGDENLQIILEKYERGDTAELEELIRSGCFSRKQSIDLLDGLDFDFLNALNTDDDANDPFQDVLLGYTGNHDHRYSFSELDNGLDPDIKQEHFRRNSLSDNIDNTHFQHHGGTIPKANGNELRNVVHEHTYLGHSTKNDADEIDISAYRNLALILQSKETYDYDAHDQISTDAFKNRSKGISSSNNYIVKNKRNEKDKRRLSNNEALGDLPDHLPEPNFNLQQGFIGIYSPEERKKRLQKFFDKRNRRVWTKKVKYDVRKNFADSRVRVKGRFVKKEDEDIMRELLEI